MNASPFAVEIHPPGWHFPAEAVWVAGWIDPAFAGGVSDLRAWIDGNPAMGLYGLPRPEIERRWRAGGGGGPPYAGFSFLLQPPRGATTLRLEARNPTGQWTEFFRTAIRVDPAAPVARPLSVPEKVPDLLIAVLREHAARPELTLEQCAGAIIDAARASPLNALPPPPLFGALEGPTETGWLRYGRLTVHGWLAHRSRRIVRLTALADATPETVLLHGLPRTGVEKIFADLPGKEASQFVGRVDLPARFSSPVLLKIFAELDSGEKVLAFARRFEPRVIAGNDRPLPPLSPALFLRALRALRGAAAAGGVHLGTARNWWIGGREAWAHYRAEAPRADRGTELAPMPSLNPPDRGQLRLLIATHNLKFEGAPWFIFELARFLQEQPGTTITFVSPEDGPLRAVLESAGMAVKVLDVSAALGAKSPAEFRSALRAAGAGINWSDYDAVVANTMVTFWAVHLASLQGKPAVLYVHESSPIRRFFEPLLAPALFGQVEEAFRRASRVIFTADSTRRVHSHLGNRRNFLLLPSWVDAARIDAFAAQHAPAALRRKHGFDPEATLLVNIGSLCERKGQHIFIRAIELLRDALPRDFPGRKIEFVMVGARPGPYLETLREECRLHALEAQVKFVPETGEIYDFYQLADIFVCTSFEESFPRVLLEAAAFRRPIVTTNVDGIAEMFGAGDAWLTAPGDRDQLAAAMHSALAAHFAGDVRRANQARATVEGKYHHQLSLPLHLAALRQAVRARR